MTSTDKQPIADQLATIASDAAEIVQAALQQLNALSLRANLIREHTQQVSVELRQFLGQFSLESGLPGGSLSSPEFGGGMIDLERMRADVAQIAIDESQANAMAESLESINSALDAAVEHFSSPWALTRTLDPTNGQVQAATNQAREEELKRLSREIHDGPAQVLANAIFHVQNVEQIAKRTPESVLDELAQLREILKEGVSEVRRFMFDLQPTTLQDYGLGTSIERYVDTYGKLRGQRWSCTIIGVIPDLTPEQDLVVFRIVQESLHNAQKHAGPDATVDVTMQAIERTLEVRIKDNGVGFDTALVAPKMTSGAGLTGMRDRATGVHAQLFIESQLGAGTTVTLILTTGDQPDSGAFALVS